MLKSIRRALELVGIGLIVPTIAAFLLLIPNDLGPLLVFCLGALYTGALAGASKDDDDVDETGFAALLVCWFLWVVVGGGTALLSSGHTSVSHTTLLISSIVYGALAISGGEKQLRKLQQAKTKKQQAEEQAKREKFEAGVIKLVGDDKLARGFLLALNQLTEYVPEEGNRLLQAVTADLERFVLLESLIPTTDNEIMRADAEKERDEIATEARQLCAELTAEALEAIRVQQAIESEATLGDGKPQLIEARRDFRRYLDGLKEVQGITPGSPAGDRALREEFKQLEPAPEVRELPNVPKARRIGRGS